ncbi:MAG: adenylate cyclase [Parasphingorhabdus sp.]|jgi:adenylate cyclase
MLKNLSMTLIGLAVTAFFALVSTGYIQLSFLQLLEYVSYDARIRLTASGVKDPRVVIVDIDERSLVEEGRWPWRRDKIGLLVSRLINDYDVETVAFDMVFAEKEQNYSIDQLREFALADGDLELIDRINMYQPRLDLDTVFANSIRQTGKVILGYYFHHDFEETSQVGVLPEPLFPAAAKLNNSTFAVRATGYAGNLEKLQKDAQNAGYFSNPVVDEDGIYRRMPMLVDFNGDMYPALALATVQAYLGISAEPVLVSVPNAGSDYPALEALDIAGVTVPIDANANALVPYQGPEGTFSYISATDIIRGTVNDPERLAGTIVLVGTTAAGLVDLRPTPVQNVYPGVEVHANLIIGMMDGIIKKQPAYTVAVGLILVIFLGVLLSVLLPRVRPVYGAMLGMAAIATVTGINFYAWTELHHVLPFALPIALVLIIYVLNTMYGFFFEARSRGQLGILFGQYIPPELVGEMSRNPSSYSLEGEKRELTVLFSDVRNFTTISESMEPKELTRMMNSFLTPLTRAVHERKGTIDKYMGDALMAFWGAPIPDEKHARNAVASALEMIHRIDELQGHFRDEGWSEIRVGIGINTGDMSVGNMGSEFRVAYTVMGDAVNLGSRIEGLTRRYGVSIIVTESTVKAAPEYAYLKLDLVRVKGKKLPVSIFSPIGLESELDQEIKPFILNHHQAVEQYLAGEFDQAMNVFGNKPAISEFEELYRIYAQRIQVFYSDPPGSDWDGVFIYEEK